MKVVRKGKRERGHGSGRVSVVAAVLSPWVVTSVVAILASLWIAARLLSGPAG